MREALAFAAVVDTNPMLEPDAIVVLSGDGVGRLDFALGLMRACRRAPSLCLSGGLDRPPFSLTARELARRAIEKGVDPERLVIEGEGTNTREQAVNVVQMAVEREWARIILVASPFHSYRAYLAFVQALLDQCVADKIHVINAPASHLRWGQVPDGMTVDRIALLMEELDKIEAYRDMGHVATYAEGLDYLRHWEGK